MIYTLGQKIGKKNSTFFDIDVSRNTGSDADKQQKEDALKAVPELKGIADKISPKELYNRARVISKLKEMANNPAQTFGKVKANLNAVAVNAAVADLRLVTDALINNSNVAAVGDLKLQATFLGWDGPGDTNLAILRRVEMTYRKFIGNVVNDGQLTASLFATPEKAPESAESEIIRQRTRLGTFLVALENKHPDAEYKNMFTITHQRLAEGWSLDRIMDNPFRGKDTLRKVIQSEWNIDLDSVLTENGKIKAMRAIEATQEAGQATVKATVESMGKIKGMDKAGDDADKKKTAINEDNSLLPNQKKLLVELIDKLDNEKKSCMDFAQKKYDEIFSAIPDSDPYKEQVKRGKVAMIDELATDKAYANILDGYISTHGDEGLGGLLQMYNDMKGLNGLLNFTDENAKMTKEIAIMVASMVLTAGIGPVLGAIGVGARVVAGANIVRGVQLTKNAGVIKRAYTGVTNGAKFVVRTSAVGVARVAEGGVALNDAAQANKLTKTAGEAIKFTTADSLIKAACREEGQVPGFSNFMERLAINTVMFGAFSGMEGVLNRTVLGPLLQRFGAKLPSGTWALPNATANFTLNTITLSAGDILVMQGLHAAETGNLEWDWMSAFQALAFRGGMKGAEATFPKLAKRFKESETGKKFLEKAEMQKQGIYINAEGKRVSTGVADKKTLDQNFALEPAARITKAEELLGRKLGTEEVAALEKAHEAPMGENVRKGKILMDKGKFTRQEAEILMDKGIAGKGESAKYYGEADKLIISKSNGSDLKKFQTEGFDLTSQGFDGWNVKQSQKKGEVTYTLEHPEHGTHTFKSPQEVQAFLKPKDAPQTITQVSPQETLPVSGGEIQNVPSQSQIRNTIKRQLAGSMSPDGTISLDALGLPGWKVKKLPQGSAAADNVFELIIPGKDPIRIEGSGNLEKQIQQEARLTISSGESVAPNTKLTPEEQAALKERIRSRTGDKKNNLEELSGKEDAIRERVKSADTSPEFSLSEKKEVVAKIRAEIRNAMSDPKALEARIDRQFAERSKIREEFGLAGDDPYMTDYSKISLEGDTTGSLKWKLGTLKSLENYIFNDTLTMGIVTRTKKLGTLEEIQAQTKVVIEGKDFQMSTSRIMEREALRVRAKELGLPDTVVAPLDAPGVAPEGTRTQSHSDTVDLGAQARINREHGLDGANKPLTEADLLKGSFRDEMKDIMKMSDAEFQQGLKDTQTIGTKNESRPYGKEMYEAAAKVRKMSDTEIIQNADAMIKANRKAMGEGHTKNLTETQKANIETAISKTEGDITKMKEELKRLEGEQENLWERSTHGEDPASADLYKKNQELIDKKLADIAQAEKHLDGLKADRDGTMSMSEKARLVAENAALRSRLKDIIGTYSELPPTVTDGPIKDPVAFLRDFDKRWLLIPALLAALLALHSCQGDKDPIPLPVPCTPEDVLASCQSCYNRDAAPQLTERLINGKKATDTYRMGVSKRWMGRSDWKNLEKQFLLDKQAGNLPPNTDFIKSMEKIMTKSFTPDNVRDLQHCIAMLDGGVSTDSKNSQDGMLGPITTKKIKEYMTRCEIEAKSTPK